MKRYIHQKIKNSLKIKKKIMTKLKFKFEASRQDKQNKWLEVPFSPLVNRID